ncbi:MAG: hypothetical protein M0Q13_03210 [Methanothrix sp.]|jgi:hypothetical protein|nr:hypothetical protein [Methanothrix sp.]
MSEIKKFNHDNKTIYSSDREVIAVFRNGRYEELLDLDLAQRMVSDVNVFWSEDAYELFKDINNKLGKFLEFRKTIEDFESEERGTVLGRQIASRERIRLDKDKMRIIDKIASLLGDSGLKPLSDVEISGEVNPKYISFFKNNIWFEVLIYKLFDSTSFRHKETIFNCDIIGKSGLKHQIDVALITPMHISLIEAKSRKFKREDLMNMIGKKSDINADVGFLITGESYVEGKEFEDKYRNMFVIDRIFGDTFDNTLKTIEGKY